jgi:hypothetical protein
MFDKDQNPLQLIFDSLITTDFKKTTTISNDEVDIIFEKLKAFKYHELVSNSSEVQNFYLIYLFCNLLNEHLQINYKLDTNDIDYKYYLPNIINILITKFDSCRKILFRDIKTIYKQVEQACQSVVEFYLLFYNSEPNVIQNDILNIFFIKIFREHNPLNVDDLREYYNSLLRYLFYSYLKSKTDGFIDSDLSPVISKEERFINQSVRSKLYNNGIKISEILELCHESPTLKTINKKYYSVKYNILTNELQKIYSLILNKDSLEDPRLLLLLTNSERCINLEHIKKKIPIIYKILRCIHIDDGKSLSPEFMDQVQKVIYSILFIHFNGNLSEDMLLPMIDSISKKITTSLCSGSYMDILTLEIMNIENSNFLIQLRTFFNIILNEIELDIQYIS